MIAQMVSLRAYRSFLLLGTLVLVPVSGCKKTGPAVADVATAHLLQPQGKVSVRPPERDAQPHPGTGNEALAAGSEVLTGDDGSCDVVFSGNVIVHLGPSSELLIRDAHGGAQADVGAIVLKGSMRVSAPAGSQPMQVQLPMGVARIGGTELSVMDVTFEHGVQVATGQISLKQSTTAAAVTLNAGQAMTVDGISGFASEIGGLSIGLEKTQTPLPIALARAGRHTRHRSKRNTWRPAEAGLELHTGDAVEVGPQETAEMKMGEHMQVSLADGAQLTIAASDNSKPVSPTAHIQLAGGSAEMAIAPGVEAAKQVIDVKKTVIELHAPTQRAELAVEDQASGSSRVYVRYGAATVGNDIIPAGFMAQVAEGKLIDTPKQAFPDAVEVQPDRPVEIYYSKHPPPIAFALSQQPQQEAAPGREFIELSRNENFSGDVKREVVQDHRFAIDKLGDGTTFWRVGRRQSSLSLVEEGKRFCDDCRIETHLKDTAESTVLSFEEIEPKLILHWSRPRGVTKFRVRFAKADDLQHPLLDRVVQEGSIGVPEEFVKLGKYMWWVTPSTDVRPLPSSMQVNELVLVRDKTVDDIVIYSPPPHLETSASSVKVSGRADKHFRLTINGENVLIDESGRFSKNVQLKEGRNRIIVGAFGMKSADQCYVRDVERHL